MQFTNYFITTSVFDVAELVPSIVALRKSNINSAIRQFSFNLLNQCQINLNYRPFIIGPSLAIEQQKVRKLSGFCHRIALIVHNPITFIRNIYDYFQNLVIHRNQLRINQRTNQEFSTAKLFDSTLFESKSFVAKLSIF